MFRCVVRFWVIGSLVALTSPVAAESALSLDRFQPSPTGSTLFSVPDVESKLGSPIRIGWVASYSKAPLIVATTPSGSDSAGNVIDAQEAMHFQLGVRPSARVAFDLDLPFVHTEPGPLAASPKTAGFQIPRNGMGALRLGSVWLLSPEGRRMPAFGLTARLWLPTSDSRAATGTPKPSYSLGLLVARDFGAFRFRAELSRLRQSDESVLPTTLSGWTWAAGAAYRYQRVQVGPELFGGTAATDSQRAGSRRNTHLEALLGLKCRVSREETGLSVGLAFGPGLAQGAGTPTYRGLFTVTLDPSLGQQPKAPPHHREPEAPTPTPLTSAPRSMQEEEPQAGKPETDCPPSGACEWGPVSRAKVVDEVVDLVADADGDGIADGADACPELKGEAATEPTMNGCPPSVRITEHSLVITQQIRFATGGDRVLSESEPILQELAGLLKTHEEITRVAVDGHTDNVGIAEQNLALSRKRAVAVVRWLIAHGVDERRLEARGFGPREPIAPNVTEEGRSRNRRVEFVIRKRSPKGARAWREGPIGE